MSGFYKDFFPPLPPTLEVLVLADLFDNLYLSAREEYQGLPTHTHARARTSWFIIKSTDMQLWKVESLGESIPFYTIS